MGTDIAESPDDASWRVELGDRLKGHLFVHNLLRVLDGQVRSYGYILSELANRASPQLKSGSEEYCHNLLSSLLACISAAKTGEIDSLSPFIHVRVQHWYREMRRMVCSVEQNPKLRFADDLTQSLRQQHLPVLHCRECGQTGWIGLSQIHGDCLQTDLKSIYVEFFKAKPSNKLIAVFPEEEQAKSEEFPGYRWGLCPVCLGFDRQVSSECSGCGQSRLIPVLLPESPAKHCPSCGAHNSLTLLGSRSASLASVMLAQLMGSNFNDDRKCITFSDNVQDAAHRAGFFEARTYRFTFRTALQQYLLGQSRPGGHETDNDVTLSELAREMPKFWQNQYDPETFVCTFLPPNLAWVQEMDYLKTQGRLPEDTNLPDLISRRLCFEILSEYGFSSRIGRSLEKSGVSVIRPETEQFQKAIDHLSQALPNEMEEMRSVSTDVLPSFLLGLFTQIKNQGGIIVPELEEYIRQWGNVFCLSQKHKIWMPSFGPRTRAPGFVTTRPGIERFQLLTSSKGRSTWYESWAFRYFHELALPGPGLLKQFYHTVFAALCRYGLVLDRFQDGHHVYGLNPDCLQVVTDVLQARCNRCGHMISGAVRDESVWNAMSCLRRGCRGNYVTQHSSMDYYGRLYSYGAITRLVAAEHTGLLDREKREELEAEFKAPEEERKPWYPNLLSSTPTLEMGIDIGDLSSTLQCSVPPTQANYIQRIGRSGRKDGNGLNLTLAAGQAHDLYFFAEPSEMLAGDVQPPGVFLDASAVLERQFTAYCLDRWVMDKEGQSPVPYRLGTVLDTFQKGDSNVFPHNLIQFVTAHQTELFEGFLQMFRTELSQDSIEHIERFVFGDTRDDAGVTYRLLQRLHDLSKERKGLKTRVDRLYREIKRRENSPVQDKNHETELEELKLERSGLMALIRNMNAKDTYNFFTEEGLLPNYAFPEQGILLQSIIYRRRREAQTGQGRYETFNFEYERPASSGLRDLAPGNRFYAEGRRVEVDQIDLRVSEVEQWRLCSACPHCEPEARAKEHSVCPRCGSPLWDDQGRKQELVRLRQVMANAPDWSSRIQDDADERSPVFYTTQLLVDVDDSAVMDAYQINASRCPFGFEFVSKARFHDINFGPLGQNGEKISVAGQELDRPGFRICRHCGKVQKNENEKLHAFGCPARKKDDDSNFIQSVFLYREFASEAIKILVPATGYEGTERRINSLVAALQLGLRQHFGGSAYAIDHLQTTISSEPVQDSSMSKQYLVLFDTVPGGTGFLKQLMRSETMLLVLEKALNTLRTCSCHKDPEKDGCYNCLFAYRNSYTMTTTSRDTAIEILSNILSHRDQLVQVPNLQGVSVQGLLDSELEALFLEGIQQWGRRGISVEMRKEVVRGKPGNFLRIQDQTYEIEPQVELGSSQGINIPSRADFVFWPARSSQQVKPVAVFTDGLNFHRQRIGLDLAQRMAILASGKYHVWNLSWKDVNAQIQSNAQRIADLLQPEESPLGRQAFNQLLSKLKLESYRDWTRKDSFSILSHFLENPDRSDMQHFAFALAVSWIDLPMSRDAQFRQELIKEADECTPYPFLEEIKSREEEMLVGRMHSGPVRFLVIAEQSALQNMNINNIRVICHLDDSEQVQEQVDFERSWINTLRLFNIFQFLPKALFLTTQGLKQGYYFDLPEISDENIQQEEKSPEVVNPDWNEVYELADPSMHETLRSLQNQECQVPEVGFELLVNNKVLAEAELAWPAEKVAYFTADQEDDARIFQEHGS
ncbi:MAG: Zn-binding domain-containing protein [Thermodesulfobacteriota bacterium]